MKKFISIVLGLLLSVSVFAADWFICMGSFKNLDKAKERTACLSDAGFSVFINEVERPGEDNLYRILYSEKFSKKEDSKYRRNELLALSKIQELGLQDIWCCESNGIKYEEVTETPVIEAPVIEAPAPIIQQVQVPAEPQKQTVIVKINNIEEQRFDITSEDRLIRVNINVDENATPTAAVNPSTKEEEEESAAPAIEIISAEQSEVIEPEGTEETEPVVETVEAESVTEETEEVPAKPYEEDTASEEEVEAATEEIIPEPYEEAEEIPAEPYVEDEEIEGFEYNDK